MAYTTIDKPTDYFETKLHTGNGGTQSITGLDFAPNWVWLKSRSAVEGHAIFDTVRGVQKRIGSNGADAENDQSSYLTAFGTEGFTVGSSGLVNSNSTTYASWNWKAGTSFTNDASSTGIGTIDSTGSASDISGFSIVSYTGTGSAGTIKHGLSTAPSTIYVKRRSGSSESWTSFHKLLGNDGRLIFNATDGAGSSSSYWNSTAPTSSVFSIGTNDGTNTSSATYIAYCISDVKGYSKSGSYTGNGNVDASFIYTGFKPSFFMTKRSDVANSWVMFDNTRSPFNEINNSIYANTNEAEETGTSNNDVDFLSNGIKIREDNNALNASGGTYIYMAFAESPFVTSTGISTTAR